MRFGLAHGVLGGPDAHAILLAPVTRMTHFREVRALVNLRVLGELWEWGQCVEWVRWGQGGGGQRGRYHSLLSFLSQSLSGGRQRRRHI